MALVRASVRHCRLRLTFPRHVLKRLHEFLENFSLFFLVGGGAVKRHEEVTVESGGNFEDYIRLYILDLYHVICLVR